MRSRFSFSKSAFVISACCLAALSFVQSSARERVASLETDGTREPLGIFVLDGSGVHDVGQLLMHTGNWGAFGSYPSAGTTISQYPSAEWPAGSGVEHLYIAGLWVGGLRSCVLCDPGPFVSTSAYEIEFRPTVDPIDRIYETHEGAPGGNRLPYQGADDDGDGTIDEDPLDGRDNDGDGPIDEDFAGISQQMFSSWFTDDQPEAAEQFPDHVPLGLTVRQESYQWTDPRFDDFVGASFKMTNTGSGSLYELYTGFFLDFDLGARDVDEYWTDDGAGYWEGVRSTELGSASIRIAYMYNAGDRMAPSYIGAMLLGHTVSPDGVGAPASVDLNTFRIFSGTQPFENGGDPTNDFQRYEVLSGSQIDMNQDAPRDYRVIISAGSFGLDAGESIELHIGFVCGADIDELLDNAARCQTLFDGLWFDIDGDPATGVEGRETQVHWILERPQALQAGLDIRPGSCPNPFNVKVFDFLGSGNENKGGVLPVAILGSDELDVRDIDLDGSARGGQAAREGTRIRGRLVPGQRRRGVRLHGGRSGRIRGPGAQIQRAAGSLCASAGRVATGGRRGGTRSRGQPQGRHCVRGGRLRSLRRAAP